MGLWTRFTIGGDGASELYVPTSKGNASLERKNFQHMTDQNDKVQILLLPNSNALSDMGSPLRPAA